MTTLVDPDLMVVTMGMLMTLVEQGVVLDFDFEVIVVKTCDVFTILVEPDLIVDTTGTLVTLVEQGVVLDFSVIVLNMWVV